MSRCKCCFTLQPCEHLLPLNRTVLFYVAFQLSHDRILALFDVAAGRLAARLFAHGTLPYVYPMPQKPSTATKVKPTKEI
jgi:hypothetical protein